MNCTFSEKREQLLAASSTGKNESAKGLMGRLRDFFDRGADEDIAGFSSPLLMHGAQADATTPTLDWEWSMIRYQNALADCVRRDDSTAREAWDELEKSIIANIADDVRVGVTKDGVELIITKSIV